MTDIIKSGFIFNEQGQLDVNAMRTNGTLSHELQKMGLQNG